MLLDKKHHFCFLCKTLAAVSKLNRILIINPKKAFIYYLIFNLMLSVYFISNSKVGVSVINQQNKKFQFQIWHFLVCLNSVVVKSLMMSCL